MSLSPAFLDELRARTSLSGVIGRTTRLTKAGREFKACCPFHTEKSPSFTVNDDKGFYHCLAGETSVVTDRGRVPIADLAGKNARVLARSGHWVDAEFQDFGKQQLWQIELSRNRQRKTLFATEGHRWFVNGRKTEVTTQALRRGHRLESAFPAIRTDWKLDPEGIRHGIMFGDGSRYKGLYGTLNLHGAKDAELACWFPDQKQHPKIRTNGAPYLRIYGGRAFGHMKELPGADRSEAYLLGFLAGYLAADGHVAKDGTIMLNSASPVSLEAVRDIATRLGIGTYGVTKQVRRSLGASDTDLHRIHFLGSTLAADIFLLGEARRRFAGRKTAFERKRWQVSGVMPSGRIEQVYCAIVPEGHAFTLEDNILTGNCFGCGAHGDAIRWLTDQRGLTFMDAVKELAGEAGLELPAMDPRAAEKAEQRQGLDEVMVAAQVWFVERLRSDEGAAARKYLAGRGFAPAVVERFGFGFAPEGRQALKAGLKAFPEAMLIEGGLRIVVEDPNSNTTREPYDRFRARLMLPIRNPRGQIVGFGGRILDAAKTDAPKYLNSPDTPIFDKGRTLYNLDKAAPLARKSGRLVVVEGYMDVVALANAGIEEAVAPLGTALTEAQLELAWRVCETPVLCFDGDAAGQRAAMRAMIRALPLLRPSHSLAICRMPQGLDPDDLLKAQGAQALLDLLGKATPLVEALWQAERDAQPLPTPEAKAGLKARLLAHVDAIGDTDIRSLYRRELLDRFGGWAFPARPPRPEREPRGTFRRGPPPPERMTPAVAHRLNRAASASPDKLLGAAIAGFMRFPEALPRHVDALARLTPSDPRIAALIDVLLELGDGGQEVDRAGIATILAGRKLLPPAIQDYAGLAFAFLAESADPVEARADLAEAMALLVERPALEAALAAAERRFAEDPEGAWAEQQRLLQTRLALERRMMQRATARAGAENGTNEPHGDH